jgi:LPXTG-motif cell wall-anchored protein
VKNVGACLMIAFGAILVGGGLSETGVSVGGDISACSGAPGLSPVDVGLSLICPVGTLEVDKIVVGDGTRPSGGWDVTISSENCLDSLSLRGDLTGTIDASGGSHSFSGLNVYTYSGSTVFCTYSLQETPVEGWTPTFDVDGPYVLTQNKITKVGLTNTSPTTTTVESTTTTVKATTTTLQATTTTAAPATTTSAAAVAPAAPANTPLPATGSRNVAPTAYAGAVLILLGGLILLNRRRTRTTTSDD